VPTIRPEPARCLRPEALNADACSEGLDVLAPKWRGLVFFDVGGSQQFELFSNDGLILRIPAKATFLPPHNCLLLARHFTEGFERGAHSFQSAAHQFGLSAEPDADVLWLLEELPGHYAGLELLP
jgi:hypothetical protein